MVSDAMAGKGAEEERIVPGTPSWEAGFPDHIQRYEFALQLIARNALVLDAGCGVGYGAAEVADRRESNVVAVDISEQALRLAQKHFDRPRITWLQDDCHVLARAAASAPFDVIINFENIEHLAEPEAFVTRAAALLRADGVLITSTPNRLLLNRVRGVPSDAASTNPFHLSELSESEFRDLLERHFEDVKICYQSPVGRARLRLRIQSMAAVTGLLPAARLALRLLRRVRGGSGRRLGGGAGTPTGTSWIIEERDNGTAWTLIAVCRRPRLPQSA